MGNENVLNVGLDEFPEFSTQMALGAMSGGQGRAGLESGQQGP